MVNDFNIAIKERKCFGKSVIFPPSISELNDDVLFIILCKLDLRERIVVERGIIYGIPTPSYHYKTRVYDHNVFQLTRDGTG